MGSLCTKLWFRGRQSKTPNPPINGSRPVLGPHRPAQAARATWASTEQREALGAAVQLGASDRVHGGCCGNLLLFLPRNGAGKCTREEVCLRSLPSIHGQSQGTCIAREASNWGSGPPEHCRLGLSGHRPPDPGARTRGQRPRARLSHQSHHHHLSLPPNRKLRPPALPAGSLLLGSSSWPRLLEGGGGAPPASSKVRIRGTSSSRLTAMSFRPAALRR